MTFLKEFLVEKKLKNNGQTKDPINDDDDFWGEDESEGVK
jgi:hypothetical protein